ncbi:MULTISPECIES: hypothetical protein [unclassified Micromonospora]|uniref:hypothetical protein n=1 Tax=Micromonospora TaxID=1873 RepID=UPI00188E6500|nr:MULTISPECIES: hypothetical protein [unclassified Micromonospora]MBF5028987.1 hypothetical protein [Micromonospora sp. ANENR4]MCZ7475884.1 hypothetical protein [Micromonospora sp. WMMC273]WBC00749.1 hypothetical protein O7546_16385 [Micromonospora sp. WMMA1976]
MGVDARQAAGQAVTYLRSLAERQYDRVWIPDFLHLTPDVQGFAVFHRGGLVLVYGAVSPDDPARWVFRMACVAGADVPDISGAMAWANIRNRLAEAGRYYCVVKADQSACHVVFALDVRSPLLGDVTAPDAQVARELLHFSLAVCVHNAVADFRDLASYLPARPLAPTEIDAWMLFAGTQD